MPIIGSAETRFCSRTIDDGAPNSISKGIKSGSTERSPDPLPAHDSPADTVSNGDPNDGAITSTLKGVLAATLVVEGRIGYGRQGAWRERSRGPRRANHEVAIAPHNQQTEATRFAVVPIASELHDKYAGSYAANRNTIASARIKKMNSLSAPRSLA